jgi:hypothetical protein
VFQLQAAVIGEKRSQVEKIAAQISRAEQVINESQATLIKLENDRQNGIAQSLREVQSQIFPDTRAAAGSR